MTSYQQWPWLQGRLSGQQRAGSQPLPDLGNQLSGWAFRSQPATHVHVSVLGTVCPCVPVSRPPSYHHVRVCLASK